MIVHLFKSVPFPDIPITNVSLNLQNKNYFMFEKVGYIFSFKKLNIEKNHYVDIERMCL